MITASLRATATVALRWQLRLANARPHVRTLSRPLKRIISADAASYNARRTSLSPAWLMRPYTSIDVPDCQHREVRPKYAATSRERRKRDGSSIAVTKLNAVTGPTPEIAMKRRQSSCRAPPRRSPCAASP